MEHPRKFEPKNSNFQNLQGGASLEKAKGQCSGYNWETSGGIQRLYTPPQEISSVGDTGVGVVAPTMKNDGEKKGHGNQNQPTFEAAAEMKQLQDDIELQAICTAFNRMHLRELERIFQHTQLPNLSGRKELGAPVNVEDEGEPCEPEETSA
ncbi:putative rhox homeobox family member 2-like [Microtus ochrogaster]|uniref:Putative rhox homeobox family member 2-like n=1 Tax=Microtus ochrogaster TaxID=79684 RepID=A0A8J6G4N1_MICOH|nr:putative rhox homeobox family member 2-like [Microtus ochrogaster]